MPRLTGMKLVTILTVKNGNLPRRKTGNNSFNLTCGAFQVFALLTKIIKNYSIAGVESDCGFYLMNFRFLPCLVAGLAYYIAMKDPDLAPRIDMLKTVYEEQFALAAGEDRVKAPARFVPRIGYI